MSASKRQTSMSGFFPFFQVWTYLHLSALRRGILARPGLVPIARRWDPRRDMRTLSNQLASLQEAIDCYPQLDIQNWEHRGKGVKSSATTDDAYLQAYALKYVDVAGETTSLRALMYSAMQDREAAQREAEQLSNIAKYTVDLISTLGVGLHCLLRKGVVTNYT
ncbi:hypothetical protein Taro_025450 [Colocasia esculenta]|uniref:Uncharacterized protein n=1 Tax=Colocasia esculenta TaxID=4460 RepID=A0A843VNC9_COLES|nr:hypothetical protein [Colocasia esculenta]